MTVTLLLIKLPINQGYLLLQNGETGVQKITLILQVWIKEEIRIGLMRLCERV